MGTVYQNRKITWSWMNSPTPVSTSTSLSPSEQRHRHLLRPTRTGRTILMRITMPWGWKLLYNIWLKGRMMRWLNRIEFRWQELHHLRGSMPIEYVLFQKICITDRTCLTKYTLIVHSGLVRMYCEFKLLSQAVKCRVISSTKPNPTCQPIAMSLCTQTFWNHLVFIPMTIWMSSIHVSTGLENSRCNHSNSYSLQRKLPKECTF